MLGFGAGNPTRIPRTKKRGEILAVVLQQKRLESNHVFRKCEGASGLDVINPLDSEFLGPTPNGLYKKTSARSLLTGMFCRLHGEVDARR